MRPRSSEALFARGYVGRRLCSCEIVVVCSCARAGVEPWSCARVEPWSCEIVLVLVLVLVWNRGRVLVEAVFRDVSAPHSPATHYVL